MPAWPECPICRALTTDLDAHLAWHDSLTEGTP